MVFLDLLAVNILALHFVHLHENYPIGHLYLSVSWMITALFIKFYEVYRFTKATKILSLWLSQIFFFMVAFYAFQGFFKVEFPSYGQVKYLFLLAFSTLLFKLASFYLLRQFRAFLGGNKREVIIIGNTKSSNQLAQFFNNKDELGYRLKGIFSNKKSDGISGSIEDSFAFLNKSHVDEIYCAIDELTDKEINQYVRLADQKFYTLKFIPKQTTLISQQLATQYYGYLPVLSIRQGALGQDHNKWVKRIFDIMFSSLVAIFILSWLIPILFIIIKIDSRGPLFHRHIRYGINYQKFTCYKFRSMTHKKHDDSVQVKRNDTRVTRVGRFLRRTSIDELPQFINVLLGQMSVVGPRPHMVSFTEEYAKLTDKYNFLLRHTVKPGITGLAQIKGYRGEVSSKEDIVNRVKYDNFYIENWSIFLDIRIIAQTTIKILIGQEKAY